jgi:malonyl CoA-acyl carrier protein transacylase
VSERLFHYSLNGLVADCFFRSSFSLIELLAYQFASPVRWIETQDVLFKDFKFERLIELGPSPTLTGMATRTQK